MQIFLLCITVFILAADQFAGLHVLCRPLTACTLAGAVLGDMKTGLACGAAAEVLQTAADQTGRNEWSRPVFLLYGIASVIMAVKGGMSVTEAAGFASGFALIGLLINVLVMNLNAVFLPAARNAAATGDSKKLTAFNFIPLFILSALYAGVSVWLFSHADADIAAFTEEWGWLSGTASAAGSLTACVGLAVLMRNIQMKNMTGALFGGAAVAALCLKSGMGQEGLLVCVMAAFAAGAYDFYRNKPAKTEKSTKGGGQKWW